MLAPAFLAADALQSSTTEELRRNSTPSKAAMPVFRWVGGRLVPTAHWPHSPPWTCLAPPEQRRRSGGSSSSPPHPNAAGSLRSIRRHVVLIHGAIDRHHEGKAKGKQEAVKKKQKKQKKKKQKKQKKKKKKKTHSKIEADGLFPPIRTGPTAAGPGEADGHEWPRVVVVLLLATMGQINQSGDAGRLGDMYGLGSIVEALWWPPGVVK